MSVKSYQQKTAQGWTDSRYPGMEPQPSRAAIRAWLKASAERMEATRETLARLDYSNSEVGKAHVMALTMDRTGVHYPRPGECLCAALHAGACFQATVRDSLPNRERPALAWNALRGIYAPHGPSCAWGLENEYRRVECMDCSHDRALALDAIITAERAVIIPCYPLDGTRCSHESDESPEVRANRERDERRARRKARHASRKVRGAHAAAVKAARELSSAHDAAIAEDRERALGKRKDGHSIRPLKLQGMTQQQQSAR